MILKPYLISTNRKLVNLIHQVESNQLEQTSATFNQNLNWLAKRKQPRANLKGGGQKAGHKTQKKPQPFRAVA